MRLFVLSDYLQDNGQERHKKCCHEERYDLESISNH